MEGPATAIVVGAGQRGFAYSCYSVTEPSKLKIVGVAEPRKHPREKLRKACSIPDTQVFDTWEKLKDVDKLADIAIITTQDRMHKEPVITLAQKGYHILVEKPMAVTLEDCEEMVAEVKKAGVLFGVCHVLRYYPHFKLIREMIQQGTIGQVCHIQHTEPVGFWHFAHSYVRGNWRNEAESSSSLLAKCCHDIDLITYWMPHVKCKTISSMGSLMHFTKENKPMEASDRCFDCKIHESCPYSAQKIYMNTGPQWPASVVSPSGDIEDLVSALKTGPYGRCVYDCDNDVMSNQTVSMQFENGATASINMVAFTERLCSRETIISGSKGEIRCDFNGPIKVFDFLTRRSTDRMPNEGYTGHGLGGHNGADFFLIRNFIDAVRAGDQSMILAGPDITLESHRLVFMAEKARIENSVIHL